MKKSFFMSLAISIGLSFLLFPILIQLTAYLHPIVLAVVFFCIFIITFFLILLINRQTLHLPYSLFLWILILYTIALLVLLFFRPNNQSYHSMNLMPFATISYYLSGKVNLLISVYNLTANIGLFIPYGVFLLIVFKKGYYKLIFLPFLFISLIEIGQFITQRGSMDIDVLILNMVGIFIGYGLYPIFKRVIILSTII
jgi:glycopeptide antibiotics resistance protein